MNETKFDSIVSSLDKTDKGQLFVVKSVVFVIGYTNDPYLAVKARQASNEYFRRFNSCFVVSENS